jgi:hypothetical protein
MVDNSSSSWSFHRVHTFFEETVYTRPDLTGGPGDRRWSSRCTDAAVELGDLPTEPLLGKLGPEGPHDTLFTMLGYGTQMILG